MASGILCQACGIEAPTKQIAYYQNIGMVVMRRQRTVKGTLCKSCVHKNFWKMTGTTLLLGPWGYISLVVSPFFIINNIVRYIGALGMPGVPADAKVPMLTQSDVMKIQPYAQEFFTRLNAKEPLATVAVDIASKAKLTPGQVVKYLIAVTQQNRPQRTGGFPVQPVQQQSPPLPPIPAIPLEDGDDANNPPA